MLHPELIINMENREKHEDKESEEEEEREGEETFLEKYKLQGELPKKISYSHDIFKPSPPIKWDDLKSFKEKLERQKEETDD